MLRLTRNVFQAMIAEAYDRLPEEACGLLVGRQHPTHAEADEFVATENVDHSTRVYTVDPRAHLRADRAADDRGAQVLGVFHSHTHTEAYPSPTDVAAAPDPGWHYVIVSLKDGAPSLRSYRIVDGEISEERVEVTTR